MKIVGAVDERIDTLPRQESRVGTEFVGHMPHIPAQGRRPQPSTCQPRSWKQRAIAEPT